jgi:hypothetical protein
MIEEGHYEAYAEPDHAQINRGNIVDVAEPSESLGVRQDWLIKNAKAFSGYASAKGAGNTLQREVARRNGGARCR